jgi:hypothetical protein
MTLVATASARAGGGRIMPPEATPLGWSLDDMAAAVANFSISGNDPAFFPDTPFQIIYRHPGNSFNVEPGSYFYIKFFFIDDSPPIAGDWPADQDEAAGYIFDPDQLGGHDLEIIVDGKSNSLDDPGYIGGPVLTPDSPDGSEHMIQMGAFLSPLPPGVHHLTIQGVFDGPILDPFGGPLAFHIDYTVTVK